MIGGRGMVRRMDSGRGKSKKRRQRKKRRIKWSWKTSREGRGAEK